MGSRAVSPVAPSLRVVYFAVVFTTAAAATLVFWNVIAVDGVQPIDWPLAAAFALLMTWLSLGFWASMVGFGVCVASPRGRAAPDVAEIADDDLSPLPRTAILLPVHDEDATRLAATIVAERASLDATRHGASFDLFVLSDTTDPALWVEEEEAWAGAAARASAGRVYYRHRAKNRGRKAGNIENWCARWGADYRYMTILDADSLMEGATLVRMVREMERDPDLAILQTTPRIVNQLTLFARLTQFAQSVYGPLHRAGFAVLSSRDANYWGHNAVLRTEAFADCCGLPRLPGSPPLGGEILSHDFVEAALLRRAGWHVRLADDLGGSYEEAPPTLAGYAQRDQRWCQGNLQHLRLSVSDGFHPASRFHFLTGAMAYLSSPLWLAFLALSVFAGATWTRAAPPRAPFAFALLVATAAMLLLPKLGGFALLLLDRRRLAAHGGVARAALGTALEIVVSALVAPIFMLLHTQFVASALRGRSVSWTRQSRDAERVTLADAARVHGVHTAAGVAGAAVVAAVAPHLFLWTLPVFAGLLFSIPLAMALGSVRAGAALRRARLLLTRDEHLPSPILERFRAERRASQALARSRPADDPIDRVLREPVLHMIHVDGLRDAAPPAAAPSPAVLAHVLRRGACSLRRADRMTLLLDAPTLRRLHRAFWTSRVAIDATAS